MRGARHGSCAVTWYVALRASSGLAHARRRVVVIVVRRLSHLPREPGKPPAEGEAGKGRRGRRDVPDDARARTCSIGVVYLMLGGALIATSFGWNPFGDAFGPHGEAGHGPGARPRRRTAPRASRSTTPRPRRSTARRRSRPRQRICELAAVLGVLADVLEHVGVGHDDLAEVVGGQAQREALAARDDLALERAVRRGARSRRSARRGRASRAGPRRAGRRTRRRARCRARRAARRRDQHAAGVDLEELEPRGELRALRSSNGRNSGLVRVQRSTSRSRTKRSTAASTSPWFASTC